MEDQGQDVGPIKRSHKTVPVQQDFLFVDASEAKTSRQGRRNARSFLMQKARRERPWSTSKQAAKQRAQESPSPQSSGTPASTSTPNTASSSPTTESGRTGYFPTFEPTDAGSFERSICSNCNIFVARHGQTLCPKCIVVRPAGSVKGPSNGRLDPFGTSSVKLDESMSELVTHCKLSPLLSVWEAFHRGQVCAISDPGVSQHLETSNTQGRTFDQPCSDAATSWNEHTLTDFLQLSMKWLQA